MSSAENSIENGRAADQTYLFGGAIINKESPRAADQALSRRIRVSLMVRGFVIHSPESLFVYGSASGCRESQVQPQCRT
jgi:hypothetical protein